MTARVTSSAPVAALTGRRVMIWTVAFFAVVCAVNGVLVYLALGTFNGEAAAGAYRSGTEYNRQLAAVAAQKELRWAVAADFDATAAGSVRVNATYRDAEGHPLDGLHVVAEVRRPASRGHDFVQELIARGDGRYGATVAMPLAGQWQVRLRAARSDGPPYLLDYRVIAR